MVEIAVRVPGVGVVNMRVWIAVRVGDVVVVAVVVVTPRMFTMSM